MRNDKQTIAKSGGRKAKPKRTPPALNASHRQVETKWREDHPELFSSYAGQWIALQGEKIIATGRDLSGVIRRARSRGISSPYVFFVEADSNVASLGV